MRPGLEKSWAFLACSLALALAETAIYPFLIFVLGWTSRNEFLALAAVMAGFACGASGHVGARASRAVCALASLFCLLASAFFPFLVAAPPESVRALAAAAAFSTLMVPGLLLSAGMYGGAQPEFAYRRSNLLAAAAVVATWLALAFLGFRAVFAGAGLMFAGLSLAGGKPGAPPPAFTWPEAALTALLGMISSCFVAFFFGLLHVSLRPHSVEFSFCMLLTFLALGLSPWRVFRSSKRALGFGLASTVALACAGPFLLEKGLACQVGSCGPGFFLAQTLLVAAVCFAPYFFFAAAVPLRQREAPGANHLFACSLGNIAGFAISVGAGGGQPAGIFLSLMLALGMVYFLVVRCWKEAITCAAAALVAMLAAGPLTDHWLLAGYVSRQSHRFASWQDPYPKGARIVPDLLQVTRTRGETGYLARPGGRSQELQLGLGGYVTNMYSALDQLRGLVAADLLSPAEPRVLLLGLGSHATLAALRRLLDQTSRSHVAIDVVDNFAPFEEPAFRQALARSHGFSWQAAGRTRFFPEDAVRFVLGSPPGTYGAVIWNLTLPNFGSFNRIYTREFLAAVRAALAPNGVFVANSRPGRQSDCLFQGAAPHFYRVGRAREGEWGVLIGSHRELKGEPAQFSCGAASLPSFDRPGSFDFFQWPPVPPDASAAPAEIQAGRAGEFLWLLDSAEGDLDTSRLALYTFPGFEPVSARILCAQNSRLRCPNSAAQER